MPVNNRLSLIGASVPSSSKWCAGRHIASISKKE